MFAKLMKNESIKKFAIGAVTTCTAIIGVATACAGVKAAMNAGFTVLDGVSDSVDKIVNDNKKRSNAAEGAHIPVIHVVEVDLETDNSMPDKNEKVEDGTGGGEAVAE